MKISREAIPWLGMLLLAAGVFYAVATLDAQAARLPADIGDLSTSTVIEVRNDQGQVIAHGQFNPEVDDDGDEERRAQLSSLGAHPDAAGEAEIEVTRHDDGVLEQEVELEVRGLDARMAVVIVVDGRELGRTMTDDRGAVDVEWN